MFSLRTGEWKLIDDAITQKASLYHLLSDPNEQNDLHKENPAMLETLKHELSKHEKLSVNGNDFSQMSAQEEARLKSALKGLGYVD